VSGEERSAATPLLELRGLELVLGSFRLGPLRLALERGDYLVLLGPSGCGKTTLLRALAGIYPAGPGQLFIEGADTGTAAPHRRPVGYVSQTADLFPHMDVSANIAFGLSYLGLTGAERRARVGELAAMLNVSGLLERAPATLSGGEAKRVALARSLVLRPRLLLLDEPLSMLDHNARRRMLELLREVHDRTGTTTVHVTHDREEAWALGGRCAVMNAGRLEGQGGAEEMFRRPGCRFVAEFLGGENLFAARFELSRAVLDWAEFELPAAPGFPSGWVQIRPETVTAAAPGDPGGFDARVISSSERGIYREVRLELAGGARLVWHAAAAGRRPVPGERLRLALGEPPHAIGEPHA
jgi:ABC-type Fe3+/spermidine/putrescine transport system ATPase subunit